MFEVINFSAHLKVIAELLSSGSIFAEMSVSYA